MDGAELVAFAILAFALVTFLSWPIGGGARGRPPARPGPEGPGHPYRRAAPRTKSDRAGDEERLTWVRSAEEPLPAKVVTVAARTGRVWEAIAFLENAVEESPDPDLAYLLARTLAQHGDLGGAERWLLASAKLGQRDVERARSDEALAALRDRPAWPRIEAALTGT